MNEPIEQVEIIHRLFEQYADDIYRYAKYSLPPDLDAKDVVQEVFLRAFRHWSDFKGVANPKTWLFKISRNYIYDLMRKRVRQRSHEIISSKENGAVALDTLIELEDALQRLQESYRQVLNLRWIQGMSVSETTDVLGWSDAKVRITFHRAKKKLKESLLDDSLDFPDTHPDGGESAHGK